MVSFVVIGKNESAHLGNCFRSIMEVAQACPQLSYEIIYVDSASSDNSIEIALEFDDVSVYQISEWPSPTSGRNIGWKAAKYDFICFVDGDNELNPAFFQKLFSDQRFRDGNLFLGNHVDRFYNSEGKFLCSKNVLIRKRILPSTYGWFVIRRSVIEAVGGYDERFLKPGGEDYDFFLRLTGKGIKPDFIEETISTHHTVAYTHPLRMWRMLIDGSLFYSRSCLYRKHYFRKEIWSLFLRREYSLIGLLISVFSVFVTGIGWMLLFYPLIITLKSMVQRHRPWYEFFIRLIYYPMRDVLVLLGFFFFWPSKAGEVKYEKIR